MRIIDINTREVLHDDDNIVDAAQFSLMLVVIPKDSFEDLAGAVENWALIGPNGSFDEVSGRMGLIEANWGVVTD